MAPEPNATRKRRADQPLEFLAYECQQNISRSSIIAGFDCYQSRAPDNVDICLMMFARRDIEHLNLSQCLLGVYTRDSVENNGTGGNFGKSKFAARVRLTVPVPRNASAGFSNVKIDNDVIGLKIVIQ